ncbi:reverse transcriptase domain-containing protein [Tanacetum coccineum]
MLFPFSLEGGAWIWLEKEPPRSILTWEDLVSKFVNYFFLIEGLRILKNDIPIIQKKFEETFSEAWDRFKELLRKCPHHGFLELHQIDTFYNALTQSDQDSLNAAAGGNLLNRTPRDALTIIENKSKVRTSRNKPIVSKVSTTTSSSSPSPDVTALTEIVKELVLMNKANQQASVKAVDEICVTCGRPHLYYECLATDSNTFNAYAATGTYNQGGPEYHPHGVTPPKLCRSGKYNYQAPLNQTQVGPSNDFSNYMKTNDVNMRAKQNQICNMKTELKNEFKSTMMNQNNELKNMMSSFFQMQSPSGSGSLPSNTIANPRGDLKAITTRSGVSYNGPTIPPTSSPLPKEVVREPEATKDKEKLFELVNTPLNENYSTMLLKKFPEKLGDPGKFLIPCDFPELDECLALADLGASINLMPLSFHFPTDFVVIDYDVDPRVPLILGRPLLRTARAFIDVHGEELTLRVNDEVITFNVGHTLRYSYRYDNESVNRIDVIDVTYPIITTSSSSLTPFEGGDFVLEEIEACLTSDSIPPGIDDADFDPEGDILLLGKLLNDDPSSPLPLKELNFEELKMIKSSSDDPPELELKDLPSHLE